MAEPRLAGLWDSGRWLASISLSWLDHATLSLSNFALTLMLARLLGAESFGTFVTVLALIGLPNLVLAALLTEPVAVLHSRYRGAAARRRYMLHLTAWVVLGGLLAGLLVLLVAGMTWGHAPLLAATLVASAPYALSHRLHWLARRFDYAAGRLLRSLAGSVTHLLVVGASMALLARSDSDHPGLGFACLCAAGLAAAAVQAGGIAGPGRLRRRALTAVWVRHWRFGRWLVLSSGGSWLTTWSVYPLLGLFGGAAQTAGLRVVQTLFVPLAQLVGAVGNVVTPALARRVRRGHDLRVLGLAMTAAMLCLAVTYAALMIAFPGPVLELLFGSAYREFVVLVVPLAVAAVLEACRAGPGSMLMAQEQGRSLFVGRLFAAAAWVVAGIPLLWWLDALGAAIALTIVNAVLLTGHGLAAIRITQMSQSVVSTPLAARP